MDGAALLFFRLFRGRGDAYGAWSGACIKRRLTPEHFERHLLSGSESEWIGVYNVIGNACSWGCVDIDTADLNQALNIVYALEHLDIPGWIEQTTRGYHVWVFPAGERPSAAVMRNALLAACHATGYRPKEVFPKQEQALGSTLGNYVRLPLNGVYASPRVSDTRRFLEGTLVEMDQQRASQAALAIAATKLPRPQAVTISVDTQGGLEYSETARQAGGLIWRIWSQGPGDGHDRSTTLTELAHLCKEADLDASTTYGLVTSADDRWGKGFADRGEPGLEIMRRIVANSHGVQPA